MSRAGRAAGVVFVVLLTLWQPAAAQEASLSAAEVKAGYLFAFGRFVQWPPRPAKDDGVFAVCVLGRDPFGPVLERTFAGQTLRGQPVAARRPASVADIGGCEVLYVSDSEMQTLPVIVDAAREAGALTVSDIEGFVGRGGMIQFTRAGQRIRFIVDLAPATDAGLMLGSELLRVASAVRGARERK